LNKRQRAHWRTIKYKMSVPKTLLLATALTLGLSTLAYGSSRLHRHVASYRAHVVQGAARPIGSYGGYSLNPKTRALEILADRYRPREW
jgi:hypothetical protein